MSYTPYSLLEETSSMIGLARAHIAVALRESAIDHERVERVGRRLEAWLAWVQDVLFTIEGMPSATEADVAALERAILEAEDDLTPLTRSILPGGSPAGAALHVARALARRAEQFVIAEALFVWARWINWACGEPETPSTVATAPPAAHR
jgi:cob(I)alamin adenosyltransferase